MTKYFLTRDQCARHAIFPGVEIFTATGDQLMISVVELKPGAVVDRHHHPHEQMGMLLQGELDFQVGEQRRVVQPGEMWRIPSGVEHGCTAGEQGALAVDIFNPPRDEYR